MKIRLSTASAYSALLVAFLLSVAHSQEAMPPEMVEVKSMGQTITLAAADVSRIRVKADEVVYDPATFVTYLKGATVVTLQIGLTRTTSLQDAEATVKGGPIELQIAAGSSIEADHFAPIRTLTASLQSDSPMLYRVNWYHVVFQNYSDGTALYDRQQGTLTR